VLSPSTMTIGLSTELKRTTFRTGTRLGTFCKEALHAQRSRVDVSQRTPHFSTIELDSGLSAMRRGDMKQSPFLVLFLLLAHATSVAAQKCPAIETSMLDKGFSEFAPWRVVSGGAVECSFTTKNSSVNLGFNHMVTTSAEGAVTAATEMRQAVAGTSLVEPMLSLGEHGFTYQPKKDNGQIDRTSMFFYGHRGRVNVSGYLNLKDAITPAQRDLAANLIAGRSASPPIQRHSRRRRIAVPRPESRKAPAAGGRRLDDRPGFEQLRGVGGRQRHYRGRHQGRAWLGDGGAPAEGWRLHGRHAAKSRQGRRYCASLQQGQSRAEVVFVTGSRMFRLLYVPAAEPSADDRAALVELARVAARN